MDCHAILILSAAMTITEWQEAFTHFLKKNWATPDSAHDLHHLHRVYGTCRELNDMEGGKGDEEVLVAACYFHDYISLPKNHPERHLSSEVSAKAAEDLLGNRFGFPPAKIPAVFHAIHAHSFSANIPTRSLEASLLQDADRMEALGALGIARLFYTGGKMGSKLFDAEDPLGENRPLNDQEFSLDHIEVKLLTLPATMKTRSGREMAERKADFLRLFRSELLTEIGQTQSASAAR